jgi:hypothetical protein
MYRITGRDVPILTREELKLKHLARNQVLTMFKTTGDTTVIIFYLLMSLFLSVVLLDKFFRVYKMQYLW